MENWTRFIREEYRARKEIDNRSDSGTVQFPLMKQNFSEEDVLSMVEVILSGRLTMADKVKDFEGQFANMIGAPFAVMVNSGSSANLLAVAATVNSGRKNNLKRGDEILVPAVCWSTSVSPLVQLGLTPIFVDVDTKTLNMETRDLESKITPRTKGIMSVHVLGNSCPMDQIERIVSKYKLIWIEDVCESLGSCAFDRALGTFGDFGTFSFYFSHHMTTGEGGIVICKNQEDVDLLRSLRSHGWSRALINQGEIEGKHPDIDPRFLFIHSGYNLRPMEVQAALGISQLGRLAEMNTDRLENHHRIMQALQARPEWHKRFQSIEAAKGTSPVWFGFCALLKKKYSYELPNYLKYLTECGVENRPILAGNIVRQPMLFNAGLKLKSELFVGAETIHQAGFFIGLQGEPIKPELIEKLVEIILGYW